MKKQRRKVRRLLYRSGLTNNEIDRLIVVVGLRRMLEALSDKAGLQMDRLDGQAG